MNLKILLTSKYCYYYKYDPNISYVVVYFSHVRIYANRFESTIFSKVAIILE